MPWLMVKKERNDKFPAKYCGVFCLDDAKIKRCTHTHTHSLFLSSSVFISAVCRAVYSCVFHSSRWTKYDDTFYALTRMYAMKKREREREKDLNAKPIFDLKQENRNKNNTNENIKKIYKTKKKKKKRGKKRKKRTAASSKIRGDQCVSIIWTQITRFSVINIFVYDKKRASRSSEPERKDSKQLSFTLAIGQQKKRPSDETTCNTRLCVHWDLFGFPSLSAYAAFSFGFLLYGLFLLCERVSACVYVWLAVYVLLCCVCFFLFIGESTFKYVPGRLNIVGILSCSSVERNIISIYTWTFFLWCLSTFALAP